MTGNVLPEGLELSLQRTNAGLWDPGRRYGTNDRLPAGVTVHHTEKKGPFVVVDTNVITTDRATLRGPSAGTIVVDGNGDADAVRCGPGRGDAMRGGTGAGDAIRSGRAGHGDAIRRGDGPGDAIRRDAGPGNAWRGDGDGDAYRTGPGTGTGSCHQNERNTFRDKLISGVRILGATAAIVTQLQTGRTVSDHVWEAAVQRSGYATAVELTQGGPRGPPDTFTGNDTLPTPATQEIDALLDAMLIDNRIEPGTPLEERIGEVPNEQLLEVIREIDDTLGGRVEWPNVYLAPNLTEEKGALAYYHWTRAAIGETVHAGYNADRQASERFGIVIDEQYALNELRNGPRNNMGLKQLLVHELQHATSADNAGMLHHAARTAGDPYPRPVPAAEGRADMAMLLYADLEDRELIKTRAKWTQAAHVTTESGERRILYYEYDGGPKLNELDREQRAEVVRGLLLKHLDPEKTWTPHEADEKLTRVLRDPHYAGKAESTTTQNLDSRTLEHMWRTRVRSEYGIHKPPGVSKEQHYTEIGTPLDRLAAQYARDRRNRSAEAPRSDNSTDSGERIDHAVVETKHEERRGVERNTTRVAPNETPERRTALQQVLDKHRKAHGTGTGTTTRKRRARRGQKRLRSPQRARHGPTPHRSPRPGEHAYRESSPVRSRKRETDPRKTGHTLPDRQRPRPKAASQPRRRTATQTRREHPAPHATTHRKATAAAQRKASAGRRRTTHARSADSAPEAPGGHPAGKGASRRRHSAVNHRAFRNPTPGAAQRRDPTPASRSRNNPNASRSTGPGRRRPLRQASRSTGPRAATRRQQRSRNHAGTVPRTDA